MSKLSIAVLVVSDRSAAGKREDLSGPALARAAAARGWSVVEQAVVADEQAAVAACLRDWCDRPAPPDIVLTCGGTGLGPRDVTPEATRAVVEREVPGLVERMRREGEKAAPFAVLSRAVCGQRRRTLILNLPGSPRGAEESLASIADLLPHALQMMAGDDHV
ncbi:MAG: MogA/MoaB family molybdenum cofactor biosynthesis protein [Elusimicrobiota bacterium]